jgi:hypothetical protein
MADNNETHNPPTQADGTIQAVRTANEPLHLNEGYQPLERKGYQPTVAPPRSAPPQSVSAAIPFTTAPTTDSSSTTPAVPTPSQTTSVTAPPDTQK